ncbi:MAG: hypothetical protein EHM55_19100 [Acidobacteria bacterium]|nr:MAG: hypothetical protein EHM55_19100 [Acidobacteriota bacterium]
MTTVHFRSFAIAATAVFTLAGSVAAQDKPAGVLNSLEVQELVARAEPADHVRLGAHFYALGDWYAAEAKRHISMSQSFAGNPNRNLGTGMSAHCKQLANLNTQSATTVRELAAYHQKLAGGGAATPPSGGARFQGGAGAPKPTEKELNALAAKASTSAEHHALEEFFLTLAKRYAAEVNEHVRLAETYRGTRIAQAAVHHDRLAGLSRDAAKEATASAQMHRDLAGVAR